MKEKTIQLPRTLVLQMRDALRVAVKHAREDPDAYPEGDVDTIHAANDAYTDWVDARRLR